MHHRSGSRVVAALLLGAPSFLALLCPGVCAQTPVINEMMARNASTLTDQNGDYSDWFEIRNTGSSSMSLGGYYVTDDPLNLRKWQFPATTLAAGGHLLVFASGKNRANAGQQLHTNFKFDGDGEFFALVRPDGVTIVDSLAPYPEQRTGYSYGRSGAAFAYFSNPTPGQPNGAGVPGFVGDTTILGKRGFYAAPFTVAITCQTAGATIRYTTDGSPPTAGSGTVYTAPLRIDRTTVLRAAAFQGGLGPSKVDARTFVFVDDVVLQPFHPPGFPTSWGGAPAADYGMDPEIVQAAAYRQSVKDGLRSIPVLSISLPVADMFGPSGLYSNTGASGNAWEREVAVEYFDPSSGGEFQTRAGLRIQGGASRSPANSPKHSMGLRFRDAYEGSLRFGLFPGSRVRKFDSAHLRAMYNNSWIHWDNGQRARGMMIRDQWIRDSLIEMGQDDAGDGSYVGLFINGLYWGVQNLQERAEASHYANWNGGDNDDYDARNGSEYVDGTAAAWNRMQAAVTAQNWPLIQKTLAVDNYIDFLIAQRFAGNRDLKIGGNWRAAGGGPGDAPWRFYSWDAERILESPTQNGASTNDPPGLLGSLSNIPDFVVRFGDRVHRHFFNGGALTAARTAARYDRRVAQLDPAIVAESARWGDYRRDVNPRSNGPYLLYTRNDHWIPEWNRLRNSYFPGRSATVLSQYRGLNLYPSTVAPVFSQHGGKVDAGFNLAMTAPRGTIYYNLDGIDPRAPGGAVSAQAKQYSTAVTLQVSSTVMARVRDGASWSALTEARFLIESISINEFLAKNDTGIRDNAGELEDWIELYNENTVPVAVGGMYLTDNPGNPTQWQIPANTVLPPGGTLLIWADDEPAEGPDHATFKLSASGEEILLFDTDGKTLLDRVVFGPQQGDISTGRLHDGEAWLVSFPVPSPRLPNSIPVCGARRYSTLDPTNQTIDLQLSGTPKIGQSVTFQSRGGPPVGVRVLIGGVFPDEVPLGFTTARVLVAPPLYVFGSVPAGAGGAADLPLPIPNLPILIGQSAYFQTWSIDAGPWQGSVGLEVKFCQ